MEKAKVYFTKELTPEAMERMYRVLGNGLSGKTAVKVHSGEMGNAIQPMKESGIPQRSIGKP